MKSKLFIHLFPLFGFLFLVGLFISLGVEDIFLFLFLTILLSLILLILILRSYSITPFVWAIVFLCFFSWWFLGQLKLSETKQKENLLFPYSWVFQTYEGEVLSVQNRKEFYDTYVIKLKRIGNVSLDTKNIFHLLRVPKNFSLVPTQTISYQGKLYLLEDFWNFSYRRFMQSKNIYFSTTTLKTDILSEGQKWVKKYFFEKREDLLQKITSLFPSSEAIFLGGILFWARENLPDNLRTYFNNSWLTHFIAVSGFNITICILFITTLTSFFPKYIRIFFVISFIAAYSVFVGLWAPVVRAAIMWLLWYLFLESGNATRHISLLVFTALVMTIISPLSLLYDVSMHLSFLAVIGILYTQAFFKKIFFFVPEFFALREALVLTFAAFSFTFPVMLFQFGQISLLAPLANMAVTWTIPLAMLFGTITVIISFLFPILSYFFAYLTWVFLQFDIFMVEFFWTREWALFRIDTSVYWDILQILFLLVLSYIVILAHIRQKKSLSGF